MFLPLAVIVSVIFWGDRLSEAIWLKIIESLSGLAWPAVALFALLSFPKEITDVARRLTKLGSLELSPQVPSDSSPEETSRDAEQLGEILKDVSAVPASIAIEQGEVDLKISSADASYFSRTPVEVTNKTLNAVVESLHKEFQYLAGLGRSESEGELVTRMALIIVLRDFHELALLIYGSQAKALARLASGKSYTRRQFEVLSKRLGRPDEIEFEEWLAWLQSSEIVVMDAKERVAITQKGRDFLEWANATNRELEEKTR